MTTATPPAQETQSDPAAPPPWWRTALRPGGRVRRYLPLAAVAAALIILSAVFARTPSSGLPLDPASTDPTGTRALVLVLDRLGADVDVVSTPRAGEVDTLLVLVDNLDEAAAEEVRAFVREGGTAVVTDPDGVLAQDLRPAGSSSVGFVTPTVEPGCDVPALRAVDRVQPGAAPLYVVPAGAVGCFGRDESAWMVIRPEGDGNLVIFGSPNFLTNYLLGENDNAPLAAAVLAPTPGTRVGVLTPRFAAAGSGTALTDLIAARWKVAALQLAMAFLVLVLWRARRLGKPVREPQAVQLPGSELVVAVGDLYQRTGARRRAADLLQADLRRDIETRLGLPHDLPAEDVADIAAARTAAVRDDVYRALTPPDLSSDAELIALTQQLATVREAVVSGGSTT